MNKAEITSRVRQAIRDAKRCGAQEIIETLNPVLAGIKSSSFAHLSGANLGENIPKNILSSRALVHRVSRNKGNRP